MTTSETLLQDIAHLVKMIGAKSINFRVSETATDRIQRLPHSKTITDVYLHQGREPYVIESAEVIVDDIHFYAQRCSRPATAEELKRLGERRRHEESES